MYASYREQHGFPTWLKNTNGSKYFRPTKWIYAKVKNYKKKTEEGTIDPKAETKKDNLDVIDIDDNKDIKKNYNSPHPDNVYYDKCTDKGTTTLFTYCKDELKRKRECIKSNL